MSPPVHTIALAVLSEQLTLRQMGLGIVLSLLAVIVVELISRILRRFSHRSTLAQAMVGVPEIHVLKARTREGAIRELVEVAARMVRWPSEPTLLKGVLRREGQMATGLVHGIAVPHSRYPKLDRSLVLFARSPGGIEWDCFDGLPARMIFLILTPEEDERIQLQMLAEIGRCADNPVCLEILNNARDCRAVTRAIERANRVHSTNDGSE